MNFLLIVLMTAIGAQARITNNLHYGARGMHHPCEGMDDSMRRHMLAEGRLPHPSGLFCYDYPLDWSASVDGSSLAGSLPVPFQPMIHSMYAAVPLYDAVGFSATCTNEGREGAAASHECQLMASAPAGSGYGIPNVHSFINLTDTYTAQPDTGGDWAVATSSAVSLSYGSEVTPLGGAVVLSGGYLTLLSTPDTAWSIQGTASVNAVSAGSSSATISTRFQLRRLDAEGCADAQRVSLMQPLVSANALSWICAPWVGFAEISGLNLMAKAESVRLIFAEAPSLEHAGISTRWSREILRELLAQRERWERSKLGRAFASRLLRRMRWERSESGRSLIDQLLQGLQ